MQFVTMCYFSSMEDACEIVGEAARRGADRVRSLMIREDNEDDFFEIMDARRLTVGEGEAWQ